jgi:ankyrin repeat domain-containing protein 50
VKESLSSFPTDIDDLYRKTWQRIFGQKGGKGLLARNVLTWVVFGTRSLTIEELREAVAFCPETHKFEQDRLVPEATLIGLCQGLVTVEKATRLVRLVRKSTLCF